MSGKNAFSSFIGSVMGRGGAAEQQGRTPDRLLCQFDHFYQDDTQYVAEFYQLHRNLIESQGKQYVLAAKSNMTPSIDGLAEIYRDYAAHFVDKKSQKGNLIGHQETADALLSFSFLGDFIAFDAVEAKSCFAQAPQQAGLVMARMMLDGWLAEFNQDHKYVWSEKLTAERLYQLLLHGPALLNKAPAVWRSKILHLMGRSLRHLIKIASPNAPAETRMRSAISICLGCLILPHRQDQLNLGLNMLRREILQQFNPDGGHISRNPTTHLFWLVRLMQLQQAFQHSKDTKIEAPKFLRFITQKSALILAFFRVGDGGLAVFNGGSEGDTKAIAKALTFHEDLNHKHDFARETGFYKLQAARQMLHVDLGQSTQATEQPFDGSFSCHFTSGRERIFTNAGWRPNRKAYWHLDAADAQHQFKQQQEDWGQALKLAAAQSSLDLLDPHDKASIDHHSIVTADMQENQQGQLLALDRDTIFGLPHSKHSRQLYLSANGDDLRGEDQIFGEKLKPLKNYALRFHLHPSVKLEQDADSVTLILANKEKWHFTYKNAFLEIEDSVYAARRAPYWLDKTGQLVLTPYFAGENGPEAPIGRATINWRLKKL